MTYLEKLTAIRDGFTDQLLEIAGDPLKPSYNIDGQQMEWTAAINALQQRIDTMNQMIAAADPYEIASIGVT